ncbi:hypothetical protein DPMN_172258 [Dreissena polymorpha]|uniref:Uncharacterized protein n=1 Tax=Dreissena polymorpha TaxID=45954 RepID=A0A9D4IGD4_DREPO|nr:hypothetical protein DPMN_172258 [Dreissena polymorpha]
MSSKLFKIVKKTDILVKPAGPNGNLPVRTGVPAILPSLSVYPNSSRQILLGKRYKDAKEVAILFEETFYNSKDESYRVLCVSEVFNRAVNKGDANKSTAPDYSRLLTSYNEFYQLLWGQQGSGDKIQCLTTEAIG